MREIKLTIVLFTLIIAAVACSGPKVPRGFPKPDKMAEILADIHIAESTLTHAPTMTGAREDRNIPGHYKFILERHNLTPSEFDTIRKWYVQHPQIYQRTYEKVITKLSEREAEVRIMIERERERQQQLAELQREMEKRQNLWKDTTFIKLSPSDTLWKKRPFHYNVDTLELEGSVKLTAFYRFLKEDLSKSPRVMLSAFYPDSTADTIYADVPHSFQRKGVELELALKENMHPHSIYGFLLKQDTLLNISVEISDIKLRNIPSDTVKNARRAIEGERLLPLEMMEQELFD
ncbi:DUF4296 domain-containing protein [Alkalitalea saponilacus]|uniref:DUF4296 domain-containing protein n=1 Tax=Alkalitalea saponilacus TaxID=889453 RepID=A0A1T5FRG8_9BACT|nr:DUF4296 domain-containing protein [Alkalitalea saponilacus]ASB49470.1 hypothetical protein CDL62_10130 [Alkalitalea saponilacus]SKB98694.1 protein of unknown function [Alkalitalea saponilacus]